MLCANKFSLILQTDKCSLLLSIQIQDNYSDLPAVTDRSAGRQIMRMKFSTAKATICPGFTGHISQSQLSLGWKKYFGHLSWACVCLDLFPGWLTLGSEPWNMLSSPAQWLQILWNNHVCAAHLLGHNLRCLKNPKREEGSTLVLAAFIKRGTWELFPACSSQHGQEGIGTGAESLSSLAAGLLGPGSYKDRVNHRLLQH